MNIIKEVTEKLKAHNDLYWEIKEDDADEKFYDYLYDKGEVIDRYEEDYGGRWDKYRNVIFKFEYEKEVLYIKSQQRVGLTEYQSDGGYEFSIVEPKEVISIEWKHVKSNKN